MSERLEANKSMANTIKQPKRYNIPKAPPRPQDGKPDRRFIDEAHLAFVRTLPCLASGREHAGVAHHIAMRRSRGGVKEGDDMTIPICGNLHEGFPGALHSVTEPVFWNARGIDPFAVARVLFEFSGDFKRCCAEVHAARAAGAVRVASGVTLF